MYDLQWDDAAEAAPLAAPFQFTAEAAEAESLEQRTATVEKVPQGMEVEAGSWGGFRMGLWLVQSGPNKT